MLSVSWKDACSGSVVQKCILFCNYCYCKDAAELMNIRISGASEQNGDAAREVNRAYTLKICLSGTRASAYNG